MSFRFNLQSPNFRLLWAIVPLHRMVNRCCNGKQFYDIRRQNAISSFKRKSIFYNGVIAVYLRWWQLLHVIASSRNEIESRLHSDFIFLTCYFLMMQHCLR